MNKGKAKRRLESYKKTKLLVVLSMLSSLVAIMFVLSPVNESSRVKNIYFKSKTDTMVIMRADKSVSEVSQDYFSYPLGESF